MAGNPLGTKGVERFLRGLFNPQGKIEYAQTLKGDVQPNVEVRPFHPWDFRDFGIIPFWQRVGLGAVAGEHGYIELGQFLSPRPMDVVVTRARATVAADVRINTVTLGDAAANAGFTRDTGLLPFETGCSPVLWIVGDTVLTATVTGATQVWELTPNVTEEFFAIVRAGSPNVLIINASAANTACSIFVQGFLVPVDVGF